MSILVTGGAGFIGKLLQNQFYQKKIKLVKLLKNVRLHKDIASSIMTNKCRFLNEKFSISILLFASNSTF